MVFSPTKLVTRSPEETAKLAEKVGLCLRSGDCILLSGPIGAGKTHFARHLIQSLMQDPEDVPSPTFTLVQVYNTLSGELWHADLYRLNSLDEVEELGLAEAFDGAISLVEWPEKLGPLAPNTALNIGFQSCSNIEDERQITLEWSDSKWATKLEQLENA